MALSRQKPTREELVYHTFHRICLVVCVVLAPVIVFLGFAFDPPGSVPHAPAGIIAVYQATSPLRIQFFLFFNAITPYVFPLSFLGLGVLVMKRSPWCATFGMMCGLIGTLPSVLLFFERISAALTILTRTQDEGAPSATHR